MAVAMTAPLTLAMGVAMTSLLGGQLSQATVLEGRYCRTHVLLQGDIDGDPGIL
jgi:hypothetical protein